MKLDIYVSIIIFIVINLSYLVIILNERNLKKYIKNSKETNIIKNKYKIDYDKLNHKKVAFIFGLSNSFIISITYLLLVLIDNLILKLLCALVVIVIVSLFIYNMIGNYFVKGMKK